MENEQLEESSFLKRILRKPPLVFPWILLFHLFILCYTIWSYSEFPFPSEAWIAPLWLLVYTLCWLFVCDLRKWAAIAYLLLTMINMALSFFLKNATDLAVYTPPFLLIYILFSFFILFYFKRFRA
jgi:hypothetical protein